MFSRLSKRACCILTAFPFSCGAKAQTLSVQPPSMDRHVAQYFLDPAGAPQLSNEQMSELLRRRIKYVFVIFNENESFDREFGTFPGADGLYSDGKTPRAPAQTPGYVQHYRDDKGVDHQVTPFLLGPAQNANVSDSVDHTHRGLAAKLAVVAGVPTMTGYAQVEYNGKTGAAITAAADARGKQYANLVMSHLDCDTIPLFWQYADRFVLFDRIFATEDTPSTPNAVAMIAGQAGETQWVKHGAAGTTAVLSGTINGIDYVGTTGTTQGLPLLGDPQPFWGSEFDKTVADRQPTSPREIYVAPNVAPNLTVASIPLTAGGRDLKSLLAGDRDVSADQADIQADIPVIAATGTPAVAWGWYQSGYDREPTDTGPVASHETYVSHHQGPQYFGYLANNSNETSNLHGLGDFFSDVASNRLPSNGGVFYIRGGYGNLQGLRPPIQNRQWPDQAAAAGGLTAADIATIQTSKQGDDDHPAYADRSISEAMNARVINAVARNPTLWSQSAIIITYDESDGFYDHVPPRILAYGPDGLPLSRGARVPLLVISPFARTHVVSHAEGDHNAAIETINAIFHLPPLSSLPDEAAALTAGNAPAFNRFGPPSFEQLYLGPRDTNSRITDSLLSAFDPRRLEGTAPPLPASYVIIPDDVVNTVPHYGRQGCAAIGMTPEDRRQGIVAPPPPGFNSLPSTLESYNFPAPQ